MSETNDKPGGHLCNLERFHSDSVECWALEIDDTSTSFLRKEGSRYAVRFVLPGNKPVWSSLETIASSFIITYGIPPAY